MHDPWAHLADRYEEAYGPKSASPCWPRAAALAGQVDGPILDLGCGPGYELALFRRGVGIDSSPAMLAAARRRAPRAHLVLGDMRSLPFRPRSFAAAFSCLALIHLTRAELHSLLVELHSLLRPAAPIAAIFFAGRGESDTGFSPLDPAAVAHYAYYQAPELIELFRQAGFVDVTVEEDVLHEPTHPSIPCLCVAASS
jgi:SAM-dependent methyltransferase